MKLTKELLFNFNAASHMFMSLSKFGIFSGKNASIIMYSLGHLFISIAQYFIKYSKLSYKYLCSSFGMAGHTCLAAFAYVLLQKGFNRNLNIIFFCSQIGMISFYLNNMLTTPPISEIKRIFFSVIFSFLIFYYIYESIETYNFSKYATFLIGLVYVDLFVYINTIGSA
jgi:hypothetical protein